MKLFSKHLRAGGGLLLALAACLVMSSCTQEDNFGTPPIAGENNNVTTPDEQTPDFDRTPPPVKMPEYVGTVQVANDDGSASGLIDVTNANEGYVAAQITASVDAKIRITHNDSGSNNDDWMDSDGTMNFYPLTRGNGSYSIFLYVSAGDPDNANNYFQFATIDVNVTLVSEQAPFLVPTKLVKYDENSKCIAQSYEVAAHSADDLAVAQQIFGWVSGNITYDEEKADTIGGTTVRYEPFPDETYETRTGICYDYASLTAAMFRANGIPTKLVKGEVLTPSGDIIAHAWNLVWSEQNGWVAVDLPVSPNAWSRIDPTFYATSGDGAGQWVGDGQNYTPHSEH